MKSLPKIWVCLLSCWVSFQRLRFRLFWKGFLDYGFPCSQRFPCVLRGMLFWTCRTLGFLAWTLFFSTWQVLCERLTCWVPARDLRNFKRELPASIANVAFVNANICQWILLQELNTLHVEPWHIHESQSFQSFIDPWGFLHSTSCADNLCSEIVSKVSFLDRSWSQIFVSARPIPFPVIQTWHLSGPRRSRHMSRDKTCGPSGRVHFRGRKMYWKRSPELGPARYLLQVLSFKSSKIVGRILQNV